MSQIINIGGFDIYLKKKNIKNIHLSIHPPFGKIKISAPNKMEDDRIKSFVLYKLDWIKKNRKKLISQERETPRELLNGESFFIWGERFLLNYLSSKEQKSVYIKNKKLIINLDFKEDFKKNNFYWISGSVLKSESMQKYRLINGAKNLMSFQKIFMFKECLQNGVVAILKTNLLDLTQN